MSPRADLPVSSWASTAPGAPLMRISCNGTPLDRATQNCIAAVTIISASKQQASFSLELNDPLFSMIDPHMGRFSEGNGLEIALRDADNELMPVVEGAITAINLDLDEENGLSIAVEGHDALSAAAAGNVILRYQEQWSDFQILENMTNMLRLSLSVDSGTALEMSASRPRPRFQSGQSNLAFMVELAEEYGCDFWVSQQTLHFRRETPAKERLHLIAGGNLLRIAVRLSTAGQVAAVETQGWDTRSATLVHARDDGSDLRGHRDKMSVAALRRLEYEALARRFSARDREEAERRSRVEIRSMARQLITIEGTIAGNPAMRVGSVVALEKMGRFDGEYLVQTVRHQIGKDGFRTHFTLCLHV